MKKIFILVTAIVLTACNTTKNVTAKTADTSPTPREIATAKKIASMNEETVFYPKDDTGNLTGIVDKEAFMQPPFNSWFNDGLENYEADTAVINGLREALKDVEIRAYMGTWCGDSKRETPQFYNILEAAYFDMKNLTMVTVDYSKKEPTDLVNGYDVQRVPTFIFYRDGKELGRYVERPRESLEQDMLKIVTGQEYKHSYDN